MSLRRQMSVELATVMPTVTLDAFADRLVIDFRREVLADKLPPQHARHVAMVQRHASWWDHLKATYRGRWWWPRVLSPVSYVDVPVVVNLAVRSQWLYPQATIRYDEALGRSVLWTTWAEEE
jgi:hypothetical protein